MEKPTPTRQELRAILADPNSTQEQIGGAKLVLARRIAGISERTRQIYDKYRLSPEQIRRLSAGRSSHSIAAEAWAKTEVQVLEQALAELHEESQALEINTNNDD